MKYTVELINRISVTDIEADTAHEAIEAAKERHPDYSVEAIFTSEEQISVMTCEVCMADILDTEYYTMDEDGNYYCNNCIPVDRTRHHELD